MSELQAGYLVGFALFCFPNCNLERKMRYKDLSDSTWRFMSEGEKCHSLARHGTTITLVVATIRVETML